MSWLGASGFSRDAMQSLGAAYASVGQPTQEDMFESWLDERLEEGADLSEFTTDEVYDYYVNEVLGESKTYVPGAKIDVKVKKAPAAKALKDEVEHDVEYKNQQDIYAALQDAYSMMYEKKKDSDKCGEGTYWDKEEKKCKKKKSSSSKTVIVSRGGGYYGGHLGHGHGGGGGSNGGGDTDTDGGDGGDGGGDGGGGGE
jgi:hypothetical protein